MFRKNRYILFLFIYLFLVNLMRIVQRFSPFFTKWFYIMKIIPAFNIRHTSAISYVIKQLETL
jgi:hypothetical protein